MNLEWLYNSCEKLAAFSLILVALIILAQIIGRLFGFIVPSAEDFAGYFMGASTFLAMANTLKKGGHIRVTMVISNLPKNIARIVEVFCTALGAILTGYFAWFMIQMVKESYDFKEVSQGHLAIPLWIPQITLAIGLVVLCIAFIEEFWRAVKGESSSYESFE
jgi:TRAP-type C4-dicarboxylate transport system permease small subunit